MKRTCLTLLVLLSVLQLFAQEVILKGTIMDEAGKGVPFATVYIQSTTRGTSANSEGEYSLTLKSAEYSVLYKAVGYKQENRRVNLVTNQTLNITLKAERYELSEVSIHAGGEDPAYSIIRSTIRKRKSYLNQVNAYTCQVYIKGLQKLVSAPKKFFGVDVQKIARENGLDSNRRGILYLSESQSRYSFMRPDQVHEEVISSKFSGNNRAFTFNRASDLRVNFYENLQNWEGLSARPLISPIADNALSYYRYKWMGTSVEDGKTVNKILVIPKHDSDPCFSGYIYVVEDSWRLHGVGLYLTKKANINFVDTIKVSQEFLPASSKVWLPSSIKFEFTGGFLGFKFAGYFISLYKDYDLNPRLDKKQFAEVLRITEGVNKKDSLYWAHERPIPLTEEEKTDYQKKAVLAARRESKPYLDSLDRVNNKINPLKLLLRGYNHSNRYDKEYYHFNPILASLLYNTVEGFAVDYGASYTRQIDSVNNRYFSLYGKVRYGFSNKLLNVNGGVALPAGKVMLNLAGGSDVLDMNNRLPVSDFLNSAYSLLDRRNFQKLYQKKYAALTASSRISGGWEASAFAEWADRRWLQNTSDFSLFHPDNREYTSNNPLNPALDVPLFPNNQSFKIGLRTTYNFSNQYETYPTGRRYLPSEYPTIGLNFNKALKNVLGSDVDYNFISADISKENIPMGLWGKTSFSVSAGKFFDAKTMYYTDYKHFLGNEALLYRPALNQFLVLDLYDFSTGDKYLEAHIEHNFSGLLMGKVPGVRKLKLQEIIDVNYLHTPILKNYTELGIGVRIPSFAGLKVMYGMSFNNNSGKTISALRLGLGF